MLLRIKQTRLLADGKTYGTDISLGRPKDQRLYRFRPLVTTKPEEDHVCNITNPDDVAHFLTIKEGFEIHPSELERTATAASASSASTTAPANGSAPATIQPWWMAEHVDRKKLLAAVAEKQGKKPSPATSTKKLQEILSAA